MHTTLPNIAFGYYFPIHWWNFQCALIYLTNIATVQDVAIKRRSEDDLGSFFGVTFGGASLWAIWGLGFWPLDADGAARESWWPTISFHASSGEHSQLSTFCTNWGFVLVVMLFTNFMKDKRQHYFKSDWCHTRNNNNNKNNNNNNNNHNNTRFTGIEPITSNLTTIRFQIPGSCFWRFQGSSLGTSHWYLAPRKCDLDRVSILAVVGLLGRGNHRKKWWSWSFWDTVSWRGKVWSWSSCSPLFFYRRLEGKVLEIRETLKPRWATNDMLMHLGFCCGWKSRLPKPLKRISSAVVFFKEFLCGTCFLRISQE